MTNKSPLCVINMDGHDLIRNSIYKMYTKMVMRKYATTT